MAKLAKLLKENASLKEQLAICNQAYMDLLEKYNKLYQKYSYQETMDRVKEIENVRKKRKNLIK